MGITGRLEDTNNGCQIHREIKQNLPVGLHHLTSAILSNIQSGTKMKEDEKNIIT
jgi:hypothetical protein